MSYHIVDMSNQIPYSITSFHHYDMSFKKSLLFHYFHWFPTMFMYLFMMLTTCEHSLSVVFSMVYHDFLCIFHLFHLFSTSTSPFLSSFFPWTFHREAFALSSQAAQMEELRQMLRELQGLRQRGVLVGLNWLSLLL